MNPHVFFRFGLFKTIAASWVGKISVAIYADSVNGFSLYELEQTSSILSRRKNIMYHLVLQNKVRLTTFSWCVLTINSALHQFEKELYFKASNAPVH